MKTYVALTLFAVSATWAVATTALAGPSDGNRPGVSPAPWLALHGTPPSAPYALVGKADNQRREVGPWSRSVQRLGSKVQVESYRR